MARVRVVGLGPAGAEYLSSRTVSLIRDSPVVRWRTAIHPAAAAFINIESYDSFYDNAESFDEVYDNIVADVVALAQQHDEVLYVVPGSPLVAEETVSRLRQSSLEVICEPALSIIDIALARLGRDPMADGLRIVDALGGYDTLRGPGPLLVLQVYSPAVLAQLGDRLPLDTLVTTLHHVGLPDEVVTTVPLREVSQVLTPDHLTSLYVPGLRTAGEAMDDLVDFTRRLRAECPWDQEQTHGSLVRHLLEETYEAMDALQSLVRAEETDSPDGLAAQHVAEELGDVLFQVVFHSVLGEEEDRFSFATIADGVRDKLTSRHPHVFGDVVVDSADDVAFRWEELKKAEKGRRSVLEGVVFELPALSLYDTVLRKAARSMSRHDVGDAESLVRQALESADVDAWGDAIEVVAQRAHEKGIDLESLMRTRAVRLADTLAQREASGNL